MAHSRIKAGGPTRGRNKVKKIGMGSGRSVAKSQQPKKKRRG